MQFLFSDGSNSGGDGREAAQTISRRSKPERFTDALPDASLRDKYGAVKRKKKKKKRTYIGEMNAPIKNLNGTLEYFREFVNIVSATLHFSCRLLPSANQMLRYPSSLAFYSYYLFSSLTREPAYLMLNRREISSEMLNSRSF